MMMRSIKLKLVITIAYSLMIQSGCSTYYGYNEGIRTVSKEELVIARSSSIIFELTQRPSPDRPRGLIALTEVTTVRKVLVSEVEKIRRKKFARFHPGAEIFDYFMIALAPVYVIVGISDFIARLFGEVGTTAVTYEGHRPNYWQRLAQAPIFSMPNPLMNSQFATVTYTDAETNKSVVIDTVEYEEQVLGKEERHGKPYEQRKSQPFANKDVILRFPEGDVEKLITDSRGNLLFDLESRRETLAPNQSWVLKVQVVNRKKSEQIEISMNTSEFIKPPDGLRRGPFELLPRTVQLQDSIAAEHSDGIAGAGWSIDEEVILTKEITAITYSHTKRWLILGDEAGYLVVVDLGVGEKLLNSRLVHGWISALDHDEPSDLLTVGMASGDIYQFKLEGKGPKQERHIKTDQYGEILAIKGDGDNDEILSLNRNDQLVRSSTIGGSHVSYSLNNTTNSGDMIRAALHPATREGAYINQEGRFYFWETRGRILEIKEVESKPLLGLLDISEKLAASVLRDGSIQLIRFEAERPYLQIETGIKTPTKLAFTGDSDNLLVGYLDGSIRIWNTRDGQLMGVLEEHQSPISSIWVDGTGDLIITGDRSGRVILWKRDMNEQEG